MINILSNTGYNFGDNHCAYSQAFTVGNQLLAIIGYSPAGGTLDSVWSTNTYTSVWTKQASIQFPGGGYAIDLWTATATSSAGADTIGFTGSIGTSFVRFWVHELSGVDAVTPVDLTATNTSATGDPTNASVTMATNYANDMIIGAGFNDNGSFSTTVFQGGAQLLATGNSESTISLATTSPSTYIPGYTAGDGSPWAMAAIAFKPASGLPNFTELLAYGIQ